MPTTPLVTVLVPTYNSGPYLQECLGSIVGQTHPRLELFVVDDCSTDGTYETAVDLLAEVEWAQVLRNETNVGNRGAFQRLLSLGTGPLVKFVCHDDVLSPEAVERLVDAIGANVGVGLATSQRQPIPVPGSPPVPVPVCDLTKDAVVSGLEAGNSVLRNIANWIGEPTTTLFRRELLKPEDMYTIGSRRPLRNVDVVWWLKILAASSLAYVASPLSFFRQHPGQLTNQVSRASLVLSWYEIVLGAKELGYLTDPHDEMSALWRIVGHIQADAGKFGPDDLNDAVQVCNAIATRQTELAAMTR